MPRRVFRRPRVTLDIIEAAEFIGRDDAHAAPRFIDAVESTFARLAVYPDLGRRRSLRSALVAKLRSIAVADFERWLVFYRRVPAGIEVIRVLHGARDLESQLDDER